MRRYLAYPALIAAAVTLSVLPAVTGGAALHRATVVSAGAAVPMADDPTNDAITVTTMADDPTNDAITVTPMADDPTND